MTTWRCGRCLVTHKVVADWSMPGPVQRCEVPHCSVRYREAMRCPTRKRADSYMELEIRNERSR